MIIKQYLDWLSWCVSTKPRKKNSTWSITEIQQTNR